MRTVSEINPLLGRMLDEMRRVNYLLELAEVQLGLDRKSTLPLEERLRRIVTTGALERGLDPRIYEVCWLLSFGSAAAAK